MRSNAPYFLCRLAYNTGDVMVRLLPSVIVYTSSTGGSRVREATERVLAILRAYVSDERDIGVEYMDVELTETKRALRAQIWQDTGLKGTWPLVYVKSRFLGTLETLDKLNEEKQLAWQLNCLQKAL